MNSLQDRLLSFSTNNNVNGIIAKFLLEYKKDYKNLTTTEIVDNIYVSKASITRFANKLGLQGFKELKYELANIRNNDKQIKTFIHSCEDSLIRLNYIINQETTKELIDAILNYEYIDFYATGENNLLVSDFVMKLQRIKKHASNHTSREFQYISACRANKDTVSIYITYNGDIKSSKKLLTTLKGKKSKIFIITNEYHLAKFSEFNLNKFICLSDNSGPLDVYRAENRIELFLLFEYIISEILSDKELLNQLNSTFY